MMLSSVECCRATAPALVRQLFLCACAQGDQLKKKTPALKTHYQATKAQFGPMLLSKSMEQRSKKATAGMSALKIAS